MDIKYRYIDDKWYAQFYMATSRENYIEAKYENIVMENYFLPVLREQVAAKVAEAVPPEVTHTIKEYVELDSKF